ncbi:Endonuclease/exonuclease/phosphatase [Hypoxylon fragiforme]|uniref:Endonuclease/exonuclease/phosphatase n=1 Tax=Hypoxylon fragiforme TaxID=63214 RepID=UPI0020C5C86E|nr:Endonuclease/exonuclease/phosphatase [Hypoxylon fragiforme]KAI2604005.1 Endonuclease/exonuclease/phosphatase [Hypoxylon fragiforme]
MQLTALFSHFLVVAGVVMAANLPIRIVTFNIRYAATNLDKNELPWEDRRTGLINQLSGVTANATSDGAVSVLGLQEVLDNQLSDILDGLGSDTWTHIGFGRDDGATKGEYNPIIYRPDVLRLVHSEMKWLSPTPDEPSFGWDAGSRRVVVIGVFEHAATGKRFLHANTHLDNVSARARTEGVKVVVARIRAVLEQYGGLGVTLTGDFNSEPGEEAYTTLEDMGFLAELWTSGAKKLGTNELTYTGFSTEEKSRIDFVWLGPVGESRYEAVQYEILDNDIDEVFISDHRAVVADLELL